MVPRASRHGSRLCPRLWRAGKGQVHSRCGRSGGSARGPTRSNLTQDRREREREREFIVSEAYAVGTWRLLLRTLAATGGYGNTLSSLEELVVLDGAVHLVLEYTEEALAAHHLPGLGTS